MKEPKTRGFRVLPSYYEAFRGLPDKDRLKMYDAIFDFGFGNEVGALPPHLAVMMTLLRPTLEKSVRYFEKQQENGQKGGRPRQQTEPPDRTQRNPDKTQTEPRETQTKPKETLDSESESDSEGDSEGESESESESGAGAGGTGSRTALRAARPP